MVIKIFFDKIFSFILSNKRLITFEFLAYLRFL